MFPVLSRMAMDIISVQASSIASVSAFSTNFEEDVFDDEVQRNEAIPLSDEEIALDASSEGTMSPGGPRKIEQSQFTTGMKCRMTGDRVEIAGTLSGVQQRPLPVSANASELPTLIDPHTEPAHTNENCRPPKRHCIPISTVFGRFRNLPNANVESDSISRLGAGKRVLSDTVAETISNKRNAMTCVGPLEKHAADVSLQFRNARDNDFWSFEFGIHKIGNNHGVQYPTLTGNILLYVVRINS
ncbi:zinc finger BED domain-containing protein RICESLEEPER 2-like protein [Tanacetum coccineum]